MVKLFFVLHKQKWKLCFLWVIGLDKPPEFFLHLLPVLFVGFREHVALALDGQRASPDVQLKLVHQVEVVELVGSVGVGHDVGHGQPSQEDHQDHDLKTFHEIYILKKYR